MADLISAYQNPEKYAVELDISKIVADSKVHKEGVERYVSQIRNGAHILPIVVIKHPWKDEYAVLNGHHRFWAFKETGATKVRAAVVEDIVGIGFQMTKNGIFQPTPEFTKFIRIPAKHFQEYMMNFLKDPEKMLRDQVKLYLPAVQKPKDRNQNEEV